MANRKRRSAPSLLFMAILAAVPGILVGCASTPSPTMPASNRPSVSDRTFIQGVTDRGQAIRDTFQAVPTSTLVKELARPHCEVDVAAATTNGTAWTAARVYEQRAASVLVLVTLGKCQDPQCRTPGHAVPKSTASAFVLAADGVCVSNHHVFKGGSDEEFMVVATPEGVVYSVVEVLAASEHDDVAIFRIDTRGETLTRIPLRGDAPVGTPIAVISHPREHWFTMTTGTLARRSSRRGDLPGVEHARRRNPPGPIAPDLPIAADEGDEFAPVIEITAEYAVGSSGGPVLDMHGNAVGMVCATNTLYVDREKRGDPQAVVRVCVPAESIVRLVRPPSPR